MSNLKSGLSILRWAGTGQPILRLSAKLTILKWASDNLKIGSNKYTPLIKDPLFEVSFCKETISDVL